MLDPAEASEVMAPDRHRDAGSGLAFEHVQYGFARLSVDLDAGGRLERFRTCPRRSPGDDVHVEFDRRGIGMYLNDATSVPSSFTY